MRIEMVVPALIAAGMEMVVARLTRGLIGRGHDVGITCIESEGVVGARLADEGIRVTVVPSPGLATILSPAPLRSWFRRIRPDVVHAHTGAWLKAVRAASQAGVRRRVFTFHGLEQNEPWHTPVWNAWAARYTQGIVTVSAPLADHLRREALVRAARVRVIANGIDTSVFRPGDGLEPRRRLGIPETAFVVGHVARFAPVKNHELLVEAFARLRARRPDAILVLIGEGPLRPHIEQLVAGRGLEQAVVFTGERMDVPALLRAFDVFALPSRAEGTSMSLLEAMASGVPVVATSVGGTPDVLDHGAAGLLVPVDDATALEEEIHRLADPELHRRMSEAARNRVTGQYSEEAMIDAYEAIYAPSRAVAAA